MSRGPVPGMWCTQYARSEVLRRVRGSPRVWRFVSSTPVAQHVHDEAPRREKLPDHSDHLTAAHANFTIYKEDAIRLAERMPESRHRAFTLSSTYRAAALHRVMKGDWPIALSMIDRAIAGDRMGNVALMEAFNLGLCVRILVHLGEEEEALNRLRES